MGFTIDHVLIAVRDLEETAHNFRKLGFTVTPEGLHPGRGSRNRLVVFGTEYLELISITDPTLPLFRPNMVNFLQSGEGLFIFSMGTTDIEKTFKATKSRGLKINEPVDGSRHLENGTFAYSWRQAEIEPTELPGSQTFFIQHNQTIYQRYTKPHEPWKHLNGARGIHHLSLVVQDAAQSCCRWQKSIGLKIQSNERIQNICAKRVKLSFDNCTLDFLSPDGSGVIGEWLSNHGNGPYDLGIEVSDLSHVIAYLNSQSIPICELDYDGQHTVTVDPAYAQGVQLMFVQQQLL